MAQHLKVMRVKSPQPSAVMDDRTTNTVHHPAQGECRFLSRFAIVTPPTRYLAQKFRTHVSPAVIGGAEFIGKVIALGTERTWLQRDHLKTRLGEQRRNDRTYRTSAHNQDVYFRRRISCPAMWIVSSNGFFWAFWKV